MKRTSLSLLVLTASFAVFLGGCGKSVEGLLKEKNVRAAVDKVSKLEGEEKNVGLLAIGDYFVKNKNADLAMRYFAQMANDLGVERQGDTQLALNKPEEAVKFYEQINSAAGFIKLGEYYEKHSQYKEAADAYKKAGNDVMAQSALAKYKALPGLIKKYDSLAESFLRRDITEEKFRGGIKALDESFPEFNEYEIIDAMHRKYMKDSTKEMLNSWKKLQASGNYGDYKTDKMLKAKMDLTSALFKEQVAKLIQQAKGISKK